MNEWTFSPIPEISANFAKIRKFPANQHFLCFLRKFLNVSWNSGQNSSKFCWKMTKFWKFRENFRKKCKKIHEVFCWNFEIWAVQTYVHLVDLVKSFPKTPSSQYLFQKILTSSEYLLAKFCVDTAENEPLQVWRKWLNYSIHSLVLEPTLAPSLNSFWQEWIISSRKK